MFEHSVGETTFPLIRLPFRQRLSRGFQICLIVLLDLIIGLYVGAFVGEAVGYRWTCITAGAALGLILGIASVRALVRVMTTLSITVDAAHLRLLRRIRKEHFVSVPLEDVRSIEERGKGSSHMLLISTQRGLFPFPWAVLDVGVADRLRDTVHTALALLPRGTELVAAMERREHFGRELMRRRRIVVWTFVASICFAFVVEAASGALRDPAVLLSLGGNAPVLVADGQWWRLLTANFLHASFLHFYLNAIALVVLGSMLERLASAPRMLVISLVAGITANIVSALGSTHVYSLGISGMVFGMIGALLVMNLRSRGGLPAVFLISWSSWAFLIGLNGLISLLPMVDGLAHLGGLVGGAAAALVLVPKDLEGTRKPIVVGMVAAMLSLAYVSAFGEAMLNSAKSNARADFLHAALDNRRMSAESLNDVAWTLAINPSADADELAAIERVAARVVDKTPHNSAHRDTYAYVLYREGSLDQAFEQERTALMDVERDDAHTAALYTMFLRYLMARGAADAGAATVTVWRGGGEVIIESAIPGAVIFASRPVLGGLVRIILPEGVREARVAAPLGLHDGPLQVWFVDGAGPEPRTSTTQISFAPRDAVADKLP
jgi:rhomboid protease GluP